MMPAPFGDKEQGPEAIRRAALDSVAKMLDSFQTSMERDELWELHPDLLEWEADRALLVADELARQLRDFVRYLALIER